MSYLRRAQLSLGVCLFAVALLGVPASASAVEFGDRELRRGMSGSDVKTLQSTLTKLGYRTTADGKFGPATESNVKRYEDKEDLRVDGVVSTRQAYGMKKRLAALASNDDDEDPTRTYEFGERWLRPGMRGDDVKTLQSLLTKLGYPTTADGVYGALTEASVRRYEQAEDILVDGLVSTGQAAGMKRRAAALPSTPSRTHVFPVKGAHSFGGSGSRFGAPRGSRTHQGQDISGALGTPLVAVTSGRVSYRQYQAAGAGHYLVIQGDDNYDYVYMHMVGPGLVAPGNRVSKGQTIGLLGNTGASSGPHLHFEIWTAHWFAGGHAFDPLPRLQIWDAYS